MALLAQGYAQATGSVALFRPLKRLVQGDFPRGLPRRVYRLLTLLPGTITAGRYAQPLAEAAHGVVQAVLVDEGRAAPWALGAGITRMKRGPARAFFKISSAGAGRRLAARRGGSCAAEAGSGLVPAAAATGVCAVCCQV